MSTADSAIHGDAAPAPAHLIQSRAKVGMLCFLLTEVAFFATLIVTFLFFLGKEQQGPTGEVLELPLALLGCLFLFSSSGTIHIADKAWANGEAKLFLRWWALTILLGIMFLVVTGIEWSSLIGQEGLTINTNVYGSTYYTLVGFHAAHVSVGVMLMIIVWLLAAKSRVFVEKPVTIELVSWYWHFVDGVWVFVFTVVYLVGR